MNVKIEGLSFSYQSEKVLHGLSLELNKGEFIGLVGCNGSGKSTLLRCIDNILTPQKGSIMLGRENIKELSQNELAKKIGYVAQSETRNFPATVFDTILMGRKPHQTWKPSERDLEITAETISGLGLDELAMNDINRLSGGQRQKVCIGRALAQQPKAILLDEPTASLDIKHQLHVLNLLKNLAKNGTMIITALHDLNMAVKYADKIVMLKDGVIHSAGGKEVLCKKNIEEVYGVTVEIHKGVDEVVIMPKGSMEEQNE
ncbi:MAG: ABC transporter ATP-binding protein [Nanoarchaeota archaeon]